MEGEIITGGVRRTQQMGHWLAVGLRECPQSRGAHTGAAKNERLAFSGVECLAHCPDRGIVVLSAAHRNMAISNALRFGALSQLGRSRLVRLFAVWAVVARKRVVEGKGVSVRVDLGGRRNIK